MIQRFHFSKRGVFPYFMPKSFHLSKFSHPSDNIQLLHLSHVGKPALMATRCPVYPFVCCHEEDLVEDRQERSKQHDRRQQGARQGGRNGGRGGKEKK